MTGPRQFMARCRKLSPTTVPNLLANQLLPLPHLMLISSTALPLVHPSLHVFISAIILQLIGILRSKQQWRQLHMVLSLWQPVSNPEVLRCPHQVKILHIWRQQVCCHQCYTSTLNPEQEAQHPSIPQGQGSHSFQNH